MICVLQALYHEIPQLCLAVWLDNMYNAARMQYHGYGVDLGRMRDVTAEKLVAGARDVINNRSYADTLHAASLIFRSRSQNPRQRAAWWIDHVIQHGGSHMHSFALDMPWYQYLMLDLLVVCLVIPLILMTSAITAFICCCVRRRIAVATKHRKQEWRHRQIPRLWDRLLIDGLLVCFICVLKHITLFDIFFQTITVAHSHISQLVRQQLANLKLLTLGLFSSINCVVWSPQYVSDVNALEKFQKLFNPTGIVLQ